jgi:hypothetical protein
MLMTYTAVDQPKDGHGRVQGLFVWNSATASYTAYRDMSAQIHPSPDGRWAIYSGDSADATGSKGRSGVAVVRWDRLAAGVTDADFWLPNAEAGTGAWSPDSRHVIVKVNGLATNDVAIVDVPAMSARTVTLAGPKPLFPWGGYLMWNHDGSGLLAFPGLAQTRVADPDEHSSLWFFGLDGALIRSVTLPRSDDFGLSPDGNRLLLYTIDAVAWVDPADHDKGHKARFQVYDLSSGRLSPAPRAGGWYDNQHFYSFVQSGDRSEFVILDSATGRVTATRVLENNPKTLYLGGPIIRLTGPAPQGAIVV